ncbi:MAG: acyl-CoA reductase [Bacteroidetes bacterium]|nr:acyl-CoA reductase [Bacteroidota bacterium]
MSLNNRIQAFASLGELLLEVGKNKEKKLFQYEILNKLEKTVVEAVHHNGWFIEDNVRYMLTSLGKSLTYANINDWVEPYKQNLLYTATPKTIGVVMAGNIPIVGFHDFLCVLISGNKIKAKLSADDNKLLPIIAELLINIEPGFKESISFTVDQLKDFDAIIATGSNNTSRYFDYYFGGYPNIIRKNRAGIAVLTGDETDNDMHNFTEDIFMYYGLGCRNVSHIMVPQGYNFTPFLDACSSNSKVNIHNKYFNNYEYNKAIYLVNRTQHYDSGNMLLTENSSFSSPVSVLHFQHYTNIELVNQQLQLNDHKIQCVVSISKDIKESISPGTSQQPQLWDYADGVDTMNFLIKKLGYNYER